jgi:restriction system protein
MGRRRRGLLNDLAGLPWPVGLAVGALGYFVLVHGLPMWFAHKGGPLAQAFANASNPLALLAWLFFAMCAIAAFASFLRARRNRRLLDTRTGLDSIAALGWRDFEHLVGEAFRRQGRAVEETGLGGADGGIDLILRRNGKRMLVQCRQWRCEKVPVKRDT